MSLFEPRDQVAATCQPLDLPAHAAAILLRKSSATMKAMSKALDQLIAECANERQPVEECTIIAAWERANV
jgi:hypothetical protein